MKKNSIAILLLIVPGITLSQTWKVADGTLGYSISAITIYQSHPDTMYALGESQLGSVGLFRSINGGSSWDTVNTAPFVSVGTLKVSPYDSQLLYAYVADPRYQQFGNVYDFDISTDAGLTWKRVLGGDDSHVFDIDPTNPKTVYVGIGIGFIERSTDRGVTWDSLGEQPPALLSGLTSLAIGSGNDSIIYAGYHSGIDKSTDRGNTWQSLDMGPAFESGGLVELDPRSSDTVYASVEATGGIYTILKSVDGGATWQNSDSGLEIGKSSITSMGINAANPQQIFVGLSNDSGNVPLCFESTDAGRNWIPFARGLPATGGISCIEVDTTDNEVFCGVGSGKNGGIYVTSTITDVVDPSAIPVGFQLMQNYPNPFNPTTNIGYRISDVGLVTLKLYNVLGQLVKTLVSKVQQPGSYEVKFNGNGLASGVYFYRLRSGDYTKTMKLILLK